MPILTEKHNKKTQNIDLMSSYEIVSAINNEDQKVALAIKKELHNISKAVDLIAQAFLKKGRLAYFGAGTSGRLGVLDASECLPTFGVSEDMVVGFIAGGEKALIYSVENAEDSSDLAMADLQTFAPTLNDVVVGISASGNPQYVLTILQQAQAIGAKTIGVTSNPEAKLKLYSDVFICPVVGPEVITGSSRMKSGTAQKMVLNMLSTASMIKIGKTYQNYMIDLKILNNKLFDRGCRFVSEICDISLAESKKLLAESGLNVKIACLMKLKNLSFVEAEKRLKQVNGVLRKALM